MIHPAFIAFAKSPTLLLEHADAYADLASAELDEWSAQWKQRALVGACSVFLVALGLFLGGTAALLTAAIPLPNMPMPWLLWAVPGLPLTLGAGLAWWARTLENATPFASLRQQVAQDLATLKILDNA